jgi:hypothetical protein
MRGPSHPEDNIRWDFSQGQPDPNDPFEPFEAIAKTDFPRAERFLYQVSAVAVAQGIPYTILGGHGDYIKICAGGNCCVDSPGCLIVIPDIVLLERRLKGLETPDETNRLQRKDGRYVIYGPGPVGLDDVASESTP